MGIILTENEKLRFEQWVIENINDRTVPEDEGNGDALRYNIIHQIRGDGEKYDYLPHQDKEIESWDQ